MTDKLEYAIWTSKFNGDVPPDWDGGPRDYFNSMDGWLPVKANKELWAKGLKYRFTPILFDYPTWAAQGRANADKLPSNVAEALGPAPDWADDVAREWWGFDADKMSDLAALIRERTRPIGNDTVADEWRDIAEHLVNVIQMAGVHNLSNGVQLGAVSWSVKMNDAIARFHAAKEATQ